MKKITAAIAAITIAICGHVSTATASVGGENESRLQRIPARTYEIMEAPLHQRECGAEILGYYYIPIDGEDNEAYLYLVYKRQNDKLTDGESPTQYGYFHYYYANSRSLEYVSEAVFDKLSDLTRQCVVYRESQIIESTVCVE